LYLESIHRFSNGDYSSALHFNITKYNPSTQELSENRNVYIELDGELKPICFMTVENSKKVLFVSETDEKTKMTERRV
jgi:hypothetical protein